MRTHEKGLLHFLQQPLYSFPIHFASSAGVSPVILYTVRSSIGTAPGDRKTDYFSNAVLMNSSIAAFDAGLMTEPAAFPFL